MEVIVIHSTKYGSTEKYAIQIAKALQCPVVKSQGVTVEDLTHYDLIILGSCLLEGQLANAEQYQEWIRAYPEKHWALFTVGLSNPKLTDFAEILNSTFSKEILAQVYFFHYRGSIQYKRLLLMESLIKKARQERLSSIDKVSLGSENEALLEKYGTNYDVLDVDKTSCLIEWVNQKMALNEEK